MLSSIRYRSRSALNASATFIPDKLFLIEILTIKAAIFLTLAIFPPFINEQYLCIVVTFMAALDFWASKNIGRKYVGACWFIETGGEREEWVYEAALKCPGERQESVFWYSFIVFAVLLFAMGIATLVDQKLSLFCSVLISFVCNYVNFYAFSKVIEMRNEGVLKMISDEVGGTGAAETIKLPLAYQSKLDPIQEQNSFENVQ